MTRAVPIALLFVVAVLLPAHPPAAAEAVLGKACTYNRDVAQTCAPWGCVLPEGADPDITVSGVCGACRSPTDCGGHPCKTDGTCGALDPSPAPEPVWPNFHLLVADVSTNLVETADARPIVGVGYLFQGAFGKTHPEPRPGGGWITTDLPRWYWNAGAALALAGPAQNAFFDVGLTRYWPDGPFFLTTVSGGALMQRQGSSVWDVRDEGANSDRVGPSVMLGFLQNLYLRAAYVFPVRGPNDDRALIVSAVYMQDLFGELVPDNRFTKFLPAVVP